MDKKRFSALLNSYQVHRNLSDKEKNALPILLRGAAMRFLLTRIHDYIFHTKDAYVKPKDPMEFLKILRFHQKENDILNTEI